MHDRTKKRKRDDNGKYLPVDGRIIQLDIRPGRNDDYPDEVKELAKREFIVGKTYAEIIDTIQKQYNPSPSPATLSRWRKKMKWDRARKHFERGVRQRTLAAISDTTVQTRAACYQLWDEIEMRIRAKLYIQEGTKIRPRMDLSAKEIKTLSDALHKVTQNKVMLNSEKEPEVVKDAEFTIKTLHDTYYSNKNEEDSVIDADPEGGFTPPSEIAEDAKSIFDDLQ